MIGLRLPASEDADRLFPLVYQTEVTKTIQWDGPASLEEYRHGMTERARRAQLGESHSFVIEEFDGTAPLGSGIPVGMVDIRPYDEETFRADIGLFVGLPYQGTGAGTIAVRCLVEYGFGHLGLEKIEAFVFVGNQASRRIFEKNGFLLEGTIRRATYKRGRYLDEWLLGITRQDYEASNYWIVHLCSQQSWLEAESHGSYRAPSLAEEGFIHASRPAQIEAVANAYYRGQTDLVLLWIDPARLQAELRWEAGISPQTGKPEEAQAGGQIFPHIYAPINLDAVLTVTDFKPDEAGFFRERPLPVNR
jgi:uncharacterized protein (DUF952 family)/RimJ/RimL family protein N-acetyltransferase